uniref:Pelota N-terminal domain-containing protein n=1 Tax=Ganoderma boninense TaxID=34458 RepID=A0A5K1JTE1_9APHY|nr:Uncharacterized protein [Ganoderma boninense]
MVEVSGRVAEENQHVKLGAFHTLDIEVNKDVRIEKDEGGWDSVALGRVEESCVPGRGAEVAAIVCGEGTAIFCLLSEHMTVVLQRLEVPIPRKISTQSSAHEKIASQMKETKFAREGIMLDKFFKMLASDEMRAWYGPDHVPSLRIEGRSAL